MVNSFAAAMRPRVCECCGRDWPESVERYGIRVEKSPLRASYGGMVVPMQPQQRRILYRLVEDGRVSFEALSWRDDDATDNLTVRVQICLLRRALRKAGVPVHITSIDGWGYILTEHQDSTESAQPPIRVRGRDARRLATTLRTHR